MAPSLRECTSSYFFVPFQRPRPAAAATATAKVPFLRVAKEHFSGGASMTFLAWNLFFSDAYLLYLAPTRHRPGSARFSVEKMGHPQGPLIPNQRGLNEACGKNWLVVSMFCWLITFLWLISTFYPICQWPNLHIWGIYRYIPMFISYCVCSPFLFPLSKRKRHLCGIHVIHVVLYGRNVRRLAWPMWECQNQFISIQSPCLLLIPLLFGWSVNDLSGTALLLGWFCSSVNICCLLRVSTLMPKSFLNGADPPNSAAWATYQL